MSALTTVQGRVFAAVTGEDRSLGALDDVVNGGALSADQRLALYAQMHFLRMRDALNDDTPHTVKLLGTHPLEHAVVDYMKESPSTHYSVARFGHAWPSFLKARAKHLPRADLGDLAALEWARSESFVALDSPVLDTSAPAQLPTEQFVASRLDFTPSVRLLVMEYDVLPLWAALEAGAELMPAINWRPTHVLVWRKGFEVFHVEVSKNEFRAAQIATAQGTVEAVCEAFAKEKDAAQVAFRAIASWFQEGMVAALR